MELLMQKKWLQRKQLGNLRDLKLSPKLIDFSSNDYLGLARSPHLFEMISQEIASKTNKRPICGSTGSRLLTGNSHYVQELERNIAAFHGYEDGLIFNCGYMANLGLLSAIANESDIIIFDANIHASVRDGIRLSRARSLPFRHNDLTHLEKRLTDLPCQGNRWICVESIYSMDGLKAPLNAIWQLAEKYKAYVIVDEAHAVGACGPEGRGLVAENHLYGKVFALVVTFGKALGVHGAIVLGSRALKQILINFAHSYIYTTALPLSCLAAIKCSYKLFPQLDDERKKIQNLAHYYQTRRKSFSETHIQAHSAVGNEHAKKISKRLAAHGYDVRAILSPTVQRGHEILRISLHAYNLPSEVEHLLHLLNHYQEQ